MLETDFKKMAIFSIRRFRSNYRVVKVPLLKELSFSPTPWSDPLVIYNISYEASYLQIELPEDAYLIENKSTLLLSHPLHMMQKYF